MRIAEKGPKSNNTLLISLLSGNWGWRPVAVECVRHHAVLRKDGFRAPVEMTLTSRGFGAGDARTASLCRAKYAVVAKNPGPVSGLPTFSRQELASRTETGSTLDRDGFEPGEAR